MIPKTQKTLFTGNEAIAQAALDAGCRFYSGYPITPQNELIGYMSSHMQEAGGVFIQAESEIAAVNMVFGASAAGARAMTSSSSPGISLKQEGISYLAGAELPCVIVNMMRGGPGLGNIAPAQADYFQATRGGGHGDYHMIVLAPSTVQESYTITVDAFGLADKYRTPVMILGDGMLGQMMEGIIVRPAGAPPVAAFSKPWALTGCIGRAPNVVKSFYLNEGVLEQFNLKLQKKYAQIKRAEQRAETFEVEDAQVIVAAYGTMGRIAKAAVRRMREKGLKVGFIRPISLWPFPQKAFEALLRKAGNGSRKKRTAPAILAVEMSHGQFVDDVRLAVNGQAPVALLGRAGGGIPSESEIEKRVKTLLKS